VCAVTVAAGLAVAGCAPVKMGAAAVMGNTSVTIAQLDTDAGVLATAAKKNPPQQALTQQDITQKTLSWLIQFHIADQLASDNGITVSDAQAQQALAAVYENAVEQAAQGGQSTSSITLEGIMVDNGIPPNLSRQLGRWLAIESAYVKSVNGGKLPSSQSEETAAATKYSHATCEAAKSLNIKVNPQFGRLNYAQAPYSVVDVADTVSQPSGKAPSSSPGGLSPAC
jgi:hypothetical protein